MSQTFAASPTATHQQITEAFEACLEVLDMVRATRSNPRADPGPDKAKTRLDRLCRAIETVRRLEPDPFVSHLGVLTLPLPSGRSNVVGSSLHDIYRQIACRVYDSLRVIAHVVVTDPATNEPIRVPDHEEGCEYETELEIGGVLQRHRVWSPGPVRHHHYSELAWTGEVWKDLIGVVLELHREYLPTLQLDGHQIPVTAGFRIMDVVRPCLAVELADAIKRSVPSGMSAPPTIQEPATFQAPAQRSNDEWGAIACGILFASENRPASLTALHERLQSQGYALSRQSVYTLPGVVHAAEAAGIFRPRKTKQSVPRGMKRKDGTIEAFGEDLRDTA